MPNPKQEPFGFVGMVLQLAIVLIGMPDQIFRNYLAHGTGPLSFVFIGLGLAASGAWLLHGTRESKNAWIVIPQIPAVVFGAIILGQIIYYR